MSAAVLGSYTLGECLPIAVSAKGALDASLGIQLPELNAKIAGMLAAQAALTLSPPTLAASLSAALDLVANLQESIALGLPSASINLAVVAGIVAELNASLGALNAQVALSAGFAATFGVGGVRLIRADGPIETIGADLAGVLPSLGAPGADAHALVLAAVDSDAWAAIETALKVIA